MYSQKLVDEHRWYLVFFLPGNQDQLSMTMKIWLSVFVLLRICPMFSIVELFTWGDWSLALWAKFMLIIRPQAVPYAPRTHPSVTEASRHQNQRRIGISQRNTVVIQPGLHHRLGEKIIHTHAIILLCNRIWFLNRQDTLRDYRIQLIVGNDHKRVLCRKVLLCNLVGNKLSAYHLHNAD